MFIGCDLCWLCCGVIVRLFAGFGLKRCGFGNELLVMSDGFMGLGVAWVFSRGLLWILKLVVLGVFWGDF